MWKTLLIDLEHIPYGKALNLMRALVRKKYEIKYPQVLMLVEHEPVVTLGRRSSRNDFVVSEKCLRRKNIGVYRIERGGLATYHGPGQLVVYPIFNLNVMKLGVVQLVSGLEQAVVNTLADVGIRGECRSGYRGVWIGTEKIASVGIAVRRGISFHGIALNYATNLEYFDLIHPCGIPNVKMTSIIKVLNPPVDSCKVRHGLIKYLAEHFELSYEAVSLNRLKTIFSLK
jgi:lipoate-protein ligase B